MTFRKTPSLILVTETNSSAEKIGKPFKADDSKMEPPTKKSRKPNWTEEQNLLLTRLVEQNKSLLLGKFGAGVTAQKKKEKWADICAEINSTFQNVTRSVEEVEKKWHNIQSKAKCDISAYKRSTSTTGGGPSCTPLSTVTEVVRDILGDDNMVISGVPNSTDSSMLQVLAMSPSFEANRLDTFSEVDLRRLDFSGVQVPVMPTTVSEPLVRVCPPVSTPTAPSSSCHTCQASAKEHAESTIEKLKLEIEVLKLRKAVLVKELKKYWEE
ncbi:uncharacterized protein LOC124271030 [Haliotis rubra]|uniref:uncharacterized protein LOC124271030 n=1 Tax=Haliotis rubra TaxID=36100 RepID=UPI001EE6132E|nr:uncharacterized protein LOC124271030 [Haliotis rubra]